LTNAVIMRTRGFIGLPEEVQAKIMAEALKQIQPDKPNWVVFYPQNNGVEEHLEDEGRTFITTMTGLKEKVYVILDDFGSVEALKENMGKYAPLGLDTSYVVTFLLAEEY